MPTSHVTSYGRHLTRLQNEAVDVNLVITDAKKIRIFVRAMYASALFKRTFMYDYKSATTKYWSTQYPIFVEEYNKIKRAEGRNAEASE